ARRALRTALARASVTMVPSTAIRDQVASLSPRRIEVVPAAVEPLPRDAWPPIDRLPQGAFVSLARPEARKRLDLLVRAYALGRRRSPALPRLLLAGPPSKGWAGLAALASELGVEAAITIRNDVRDDERWPLLAAASALCFPSTLEGFGLPGVEAALVGCPVLVARDGVPHEVLGEAAIAVDEGVEAWAAAMVEVTQAAAQSARSRLRLAQEEAAARYSPLRAAAAWVDAWERALAISSRAVG
ncbi:MAG TPA: glycosyltransferase, partial [Planctomycetota bacterium]|nr:glycosyltransferase [Planctomycetota bacterium]